MIGLDRLIGYGGHARFQQCLSERFARSEMQIREKDLAFAQQRKLRLPRLLHFHNHAGTRENLFRLIENFGAGFNVFFVRITRADTCILFHHHRVTVPDKLVCSPGQQGDALLLFFNFFWNTDNHARE